MLAPPPSRARAALVRKVEVFPTAWPGMACSGVCRAPGVAAWTEVPGGQDARSLGRSVSLEGSKCSVGRR